MYFLLQITKRRLYFKSSECDNNEAIQWPLLQDNQSDQLTGISKRKNVQRC